MTDNFMFPEITFNIYGQFENFDNWATAVLDSLNERNKRKLTSKEAGNNNNKRHKVISYEELDRLEGEKHEENPKKTTAWAAKVFSDWLKEKNTSLEEIEREGANVLNAQLRAFYATVRTTAGTEYSVSSFFALRVL